MFKHVGKHNYGEFFAKLHDLLTENGVFLLHTSGFTDRPGPIDLFIRKIAVRLITSYGCDGLA